MSLRPGVLSSTDTDVPSSGGLKAGAVVGRSKGVAVDSAEAVDVTARGGDPTDSGVDVGA